MNTEKNVQKVCNIDNRSILYIKEEKKKEEISALSAQSSTPAHVYLAPMYPRVIREFDDYGEDVF